MWAKLAVIGSIPCLFCGCETGADPFPVPPKGYKAIVCGECVLEYRPEFEEVASRVSLKVESWLERFEEDYRLPILARLEAFVSSRDDVKVDVDTVKPDIDRVANLIVDILFGTERGVRRHEDLEGCTLFMRSFVDLARELQLLSRDGGPVEAMIDYFRDTVPRGRFRLLTCSDISEGMLAGFDCSQESRKLSMKFSFGLQGGKLQGSWDLPEVIPVLVDTEEEKGYEFILEGVTGRLLEKWKPIRDRSHFVPSKIEDQARVDLLCLIAHEGAEFALVAGTRWKDPFRRWFADGVATYVALECIERILGPEKRPNAPYGSEHRKQYEHLGDQVNLLAWLASEIEDEYPELRPSPQDLSFAHYAFATKEIERFVSEHGEDALREVIGEVSRSTRKSSDDLRRIFGRVSGSDTFFEGLLKYSVSSAKRKAAGLSGSLSLPTTSQGWADLAQQRWQEQDVDGAWAALEVLKELEPADPNIRGFRATVLAARARAQGVREVQRELELMWRLWDPNGELGFVACSDSVWETLLDGALGVHRNLARGLARVVLSKPDRSESLRVKARDILGRVTAE